MAKHYTADDLLEMFQRAIEKAGGVRSLARKMGITPAYVCDIRLGRPGYAIEHKQERDASGRVHSWYRLAGQQMILPCGQEAAPARVSVRAGSGPASEISVTYGLHGSGSYASAALTQSLANRLRPMLALRGSILFRLTWKERVTPSGRRICALRASGHRTSGSGCTSWPASQAHLAAWVSPASRDWKDTPGMAEKGTNPDGTERKRLDQLPRQARLASWATPRGTQQCGEPGMQAKLASGPMPSGSPAAMENCGRLNPAFSLWLMGFPTVWARCAARVTRLSRRSLRRSSKPGAKVRGL